MSSERALYVGVVAGDHVVPAGLLTVSDVSGRMVGRFGYARSYLARPDAFALDPINLPLGTGQVSARAGDSSYPFGVFTDAGPDLWGRLAITSVEEGPADLETSDYLHRGSGQGVGALVFARTLDELTRLAPPAPKTVDQLAQIQEAVQMVLDHRPLADRQREALEGGLSLGGAHPKTSVAAAGCEWIAKFSLANQPRDKSREEMAYSHMAEDLGIRVMPQALLPTAGGTVLLSLRFDRDETGRRLHYLSARALFGMSDEFMADSRRTSYIELAAILTRLSTDPAADRRELYLRMALNVAIGNGDDHPRNHGLLRIGEGYRLSPAFDLTTHLAKGRAEHQAMHVGPDGTRASFANVLAAAPAFGVGAVEASLIVNRVVDVASEREWYFGRAGLAPADRQALHARVESRLGERDRRFDLPSREERRPAPPRGTWSGEAVEITPRRCVLRDPDLGLVEHCQPLLAPTPVAGHRIEVEYAPSLQGRVYSGHLAGPSPG